MLAESNCTSNRASGQECEELKMAGGAEREMNSAEGTFTCHSELFEGRFSWHRQAAQGQGKRIAAPSKAA